MLEAIYAKRELLKEKRTPFTVVACTIFLIGLILSFRQLNIDLMSLNIWPALGLFFVMAPLGILYGALGLMLLVHIAGGDKLGLVSSTKITAYAQLAEALPLPGGAIVRSAALVKSGVKTKKSVGLVVATAILWISMASLGAGAVLLPQDTPIAYVLLLAGFIGFLPVVFWIYSLSTIGVTAVIIIHRLAGILMMALRLFLAFAILKMTVDFPTALFFTFANIAGTATSLAPAGLGVGELFAAGMAGLVQMAPATAFLAIALNRILGLASCTLLVGLNSLCDRRGQKSSLMENIS